MNGHNRTVGLGSLAHATPKAAVLLAAILLFSAFAGTQPALAAGQTYEYVWRVNVPSDNYLWINVKGNFTSIHGCSQPWYARSAYPLTDERTKAWMSVALASFLSRKNVYVTTTGCTTNGYPILTGLQAEQD